MSTKIQSMGNWFIVFLLVVMSGACAADLGNQGGDGTPTSASMGDLEPLSMEVPNTDMVLTVGGCELGEAGCLPMIRLDRADGTEMVIDSFDGVIHVMTLPPEEAEALVDGTLLALDEVSHHPELTEEQRVALSGLSEDFRTLKQEIARIPDREAGWATALAAVFEATLGTLISVWETISPFEWSTWDSWSLGWQIAATIAAAAIAVVALFAMLVFEGTALVFVALAGLALALTYAVSRLIHFAWQILHGVPPTSLELPATYGEAGPQYP